jgi:hypothetical protein
MTNLAIYALCATTVALGIYLTYPTLLYYASYGYTSARIAVSGSKTPTEKYVTDYKLVYPKDVSGELKSLLELFANENQSADWSALLDYLGDQHGLPASIDRFVFDDFGEELVISNPNMRRG